MIQYLYTWKEPVTKYPHFEAVCATGGLPPFAFRGERTGGGALMKRTIMSKYSNTWLSIYTDEKASSPENKDVIIRSKHPKVSRIINEE